ncbi:MAG: hypothetical protein M1365_09640 [Actinobacteria bacterium]|nr:hypothetical protein [Actinomycetota bacterium]
MNPRERLLSTLNHREPDQVPIDLGSLGATTFLVPAYNNLKKYLHFEKKNDLMSLPFQIVFMHEEVLEKLGIGFRAVKPGPPGNWMESELDNDHLIDEWGVKFRKPKNGVYYDMVGYPLANAKTVDDIKKLKFPDPVDNKRFEGLDARIKYLYYKTNYALVAEPGDSVFERAWYLRGLENIFIDMIFNKSIVHTLLRRINDFNMAKAEKFLDIVGDFVQVFFVGDDLASQDAPLMSIDMYREFIKPYQKELYSYIKSRTDAKLAYHSCGSIVNFIPDLIDIGVDVINPVQVSAYRMDTRWLKKEFGKYISFWGAIDTQKVLPFGSEKELEEEVKKRIDDLAPGGGYVLAPVHSVQPDVSPLKILQMLKFARKYGIYNSGQH